MVYGFFMLFFFFDYITKFEFQMNFAAEYFRHRDSKSYTIAALLKQGLFHILKDTRWKPDWSVAKVR